jgi:hypothetical protein
MEKITMKRSGLMIAFASSLLVAQIATAQMMGGGSHNGSTPSTGSNGTNGNGGMNGTGGTNGNGGMNGIGGMDDGFGAMGRALTVGTDGVVYTQRVTTVAGQTSSSEVVAIRPSGTVAWSAKLDGGMSRLQLSGNLVLVASGSGNSDMGMIGGTQASDDKSQLVALSAASG